MTRKTRRHPIRVFMVAASGIALLAVIAWLIGPTRGWIVFQAKSTIIFFNTRGEADEAPPVVDLWYGNDLVVGKRGNPQRWINILGRARDHEGAVSSLSYRLNEGPMESLAIGPDDRRLADEGDFNVEIDRARLLPGTNRVMIEAEDEAGNVAGAEVRLHRSGPDSSLYALPLHIDWSEHRQVGDVADVVDGRWILTGRGIRTDPDYVGYDRLLAFGDTSWTDYQITVSLTVNDVDESGHIRRRSASPALGFNLRWLGHTDEPAVCRQPHCGWFPMGAMIVYDWKLFYQGDSAFAIYATPTVDSRDNPLPFQLDTGKKYMFKAGVESLDEGSIYRLKVWEASEHEPRDWMVESTTGAGNLDHGSLLINAHHVDVTVGNVRIERLEDEM